MITQKGPQWTVLHLSFESSCFAFANDALLVHLLNHVGKASVSLFENGLNLSNSFLTPGHTVLLSSHING
jgi:hypothetical protein